MTKNGILVVLSSPSGGGKTSVAQRLLRVDKRLIRSVSWTTRKPRAGEKNGKDYFFGTPRRFREMKAKGAFLEWAQVHGNFYGTPKSWVKRKLGEGKDVLLVIDVQGGMALRKAHTRTVLIFLAPPSLAVLRKRLKGRGSETPQVLKQRLLNARWEMKQSGFYDYRVLNDRLPRAASEVLRIIRSERLKQSGDRPKIL